MTEALAVLAHREAQRIPVAVGLDAQQGLVVARARALLPPAAAPRLVHALAASDRLAQALRTRPREAEGLAEIVAHQGRPQPVRALRAQHRREHVGDLEAPGVQRHPDLGVDAVPVQGCDLGRVADSARHRQPGLARRRPQAPVRLEVDALHAPFALHEGDQEAGHVVAQLRHPLEHRHPGAGLPAFHHELAVDAVERRDQALARQAPEQGRIGRGADDDLPGPGVEPAGGGVEVPDAAPDPTGSEIEQGFDERAVRSPPPRRVEVDHRHVAGTPEAAGERARIAGGERVLLPADELYGLAALDVDGRNDHRLTSTPRALKYALVEAMLCSP